MLRPETERVWHWFQTEGEPRGAILIGGTALSLQIGHRLSEDLDFVFLADRLPRVRLEQLRLRLNAAGLAAVPQSDPVAEAEFADALLELQDYQLDWRVGAGVKVTCFVADDGLRRVLASGPAEGVRVASLRELFAAKALLVSQRSRLRDWFDLFVLMRDHGFGVVDFRAAYRQAGREEQWEAGWARLCDARPPLADEGFAALVQNSPDAVLMAQFFQERRRAAEITWAEAAFRTGSTPISYER